jgi:hypothetical protein
MVNLQYPTLLRLGNTNLTDHNRSPLEVTTERIEKRIRMASGQMRKYHVADKKTFSVSWNMVPVGTSQTVDGFAGGADINGIVTNATGIIQLDIRNRVGNTASFTVMITDFSRSVEKRWNVEYWNLSLVMEQV